MTSTHRQREYYRQLPAHGKGYGSKQKIDRWPGKRH